jgi:hypothetical protein
VFDETRRRCPNREGDGKNGAQCEKEEGHDPPCACPEAIEAHRRARFPEVPR